MKIYRFVFLLFLSGCALNDAANQGLCRIECIGEKKAFEMLNSIKLGDMLRFSKENHKVAIEILPCGYRLVVESRDEFSLERFGEFFFDKDFNFIYGFN
ncbi:hypothetical protein ABFV80_000038 [Vandammella animalimorsus]|uniref:hypothetical protein n=1 Tax=Vandammella animalimorsus TaxID=2029117 RepID=UPI00325A5F11